jgi:hypothetical protein
MQRFRGPSSPETYQGKSVGAPPVPRDLEVKED